MTRDPRDQQLVGGIWALGIGTAVIAATGVFPGVPAAVWLLIAAASGAGGAAVATQRRRKLAAVLGAIGGAGSLLTILLYIELRSQQSGRYFLLELILPIAVVGLPLVAIWHVIDRRADGTPTPGAELAAAAERTVEAPDRSLCAHHPQTVARWACGRCGAFFCPLCASYPRATGKPVCKACMPTA